MEFGCLNVSCLLYRIFTMWAPVPVLMFSFTGSTSLTLLVKQLSFTSDTGILETFNGFIWNPILFLLITLTPCSVRQSLRMSLSLFRLIQSFASLSDFPASVSRSRSFQALAPLLHLLVRSLHPVRVRRSSFLTSSLATHHPGLAWLLLLGLAPPVKACIHCNPGKRTDGSPVFGQTDSHSSWVSSCSGMQLNWWWDLNWLIYLTIITLRSYSILKF